MSNKKTTAPNFDILEFKDKHSTRILKKGHLNGNGVMLYQDNGLYLDFNYLIKNPYWAIHKIKILKKGYEGEYTVGNNFATHSIACFELKDNDLVIRLVGGGIATVHGKIEIKNTSSPVTVKKQTKPPSNYFEKKKEETNYNIIFTTEDKVGITNKCQGDLYCVDAIGNSHKKKIREITGDMVLSGRVKIFHSEQAAKDYLLPKKKVKISLDEIVQILNEGRQIAPVDLNFGDLGPKLKKLFESKVNIKFH